MIQTVEPRNVTGFLNKRLFHCFLQYTQSTRGGARVVSSPSGSIIPQTSMDPWFVICNQGESDGGLNHRQEYNTRLAKGFPWIDRLAVYCSYDMTKEKYSTRGTDPYWIWGPNLHPGE